MFLKSLLLNKKTFIIIVIINFVKLYLVKEGLKLYITVDLLF